MKILKILNGIYGNFVINTCMLIYQKSHNLDFFFLSMKYDNIYSFVSLINRGNRENKRWMKIVTGKTVFPQYTDWLRKGNLVGGGSLLISSMIKNHWNT